MKIFCRYTAVMLGLLFSIVACSSSPAIHWEQLAFESKDGLFAEPYIDQDEWRNAPVRHRYIHGGFKGTDTRFSFYFPSEESYQGRFFQYITPVPDSETLSQGARGEDDKIGFSLSQGAYFIETNGGGRAATAVPGMGSDPTIGAYRANAAAAQFSRVVAAELYGEHRPFGYAFGGSGGAYRTIGGAENTQGVWDGVVPFVMGSPMAIPNVFSARMYGLRVLAEKLPSVANAVDAGGGDPYADLNAEQQAALREVTRMGFPLRAWTLYSSLDLHAFTVLYPVFLAADPSYFSDFWNKPGYEGFALPESLRRARVKHKARVAQLFTVDELREQGVVLSAGPGEATNLADTAWQNLQTDGAQQLPIAFRLSSLPERLPLGIDVFFSSGANAGQILPAAKIQQDLVLLNGASVALREQLQVGDSVELNNDNILAMQTYYRHQVPGRQYSVWDQFRDERGKPIYPQRPVIFGPLFTRAAAGTVPAGKFSGKMILVENLFDTEAFPWQGAWYHDRVKEQFGQTTEQHFRLWFVDRATHSDRSEQKNSRHTVSYLGVLQQALLDISAWVERGVAPPAGSAYRIDNGQVVLAKDSQRGGVQAAVELLANGAEVTFVERGERVTLEARIDVPAGTGKVVEAHWDLDGSGKFATPVDLKTLKPRAGRLHISAQHVFAEPGTHFPVLRIATQRQGNAQTPFTKIQNLARVRVVVD